MGARAAGGESGRSTGHSGDLQATWAYGIMYRNCDAKETIAIGVIASAWLVPPHRSPVVYAACLVVLVALLTAVCWLKGEQPRWRWGNDD